MVYSDGFLQAMANVFHRPTMLRLRAERRKGRNERRNYWRAFEARVKAVNALTATMTPEEERAFYLAELDN